MNGHRIINLRKIADKRGNLSFIEENSEEMPFDIRRVYWIYDVPGGEKRGGHAFKENEELIVSLSGSFDVILDDGREKYRYSLSRSYYGLYVPKGLWREMDNFSTNSVCMILSSVDYDPSDYIRDYEEFLQYIGDRQHCL